MSARKAYRLFPQGYTRINGTSRPHSESIFLAILALFSVFWNTVVTPTSSISGISRHKCQCQRIVDIVPDIGIQQDFMFFHHDLLFLFCEFRK